MLCLHWTHMSLHTYVCTHYSTYISYVFCTYTYILHMYTLVKCHISCVHTVHVHTSHTPPVHTHVYCTYTYALYIHTCTTHMYMYCILHVYCTSLIVWRRKAGLPESSSTLSEAVQIRKDGSSFVRWCWLCVCEGHWQELVVADWHQSISNRNALNSCMFMYITHIWK